MFLAQVPQPDPWYASGLFWAIVAVVIALIAIPAGWWATFRSANPRRALYVTSVVQPLLPQGIDQHIRILAGTTELAAPHLVRLDIVSYGRRDIPKSSFDGPIDVDLGAKVIAMLGRNSVAVPKVVPAPPDAIQDDGHFVVAPALLTKNHRLTYMLLVEGKPAPVLRCSIADVQVYETAPPPAAPLASRLAQLVLLGLSLAVLVNSWLGPDFPRDGGQWVNAVIKSIMIIGIVLVLLYPFGPIGALLRWTRRRRA